MTTEKAIAEFTSGIDRGPFRCLNDEQSDGTSTYVASRNLEYVDVCECAVYQAYLDMCRTVTGAGKGKRRKAIEQTRAIIAESLRSYFAGKPKAKEEAFDDWYGSVIFEAGAPANLTVGQAQKILNMAFKYLYCCRDLRESKPRHFACCHMPLDGYTLAWYRREVEPGYDGEAWSAIDDSAKYAHIQSAIRRQLGGESALFAEFEVWQDEKRRAEANEVRKAAQKVADFPECPENLRRQLAAFTDAL